EGNAALGLDHFGGAGQEQRADAHVARLPRAFVVRGPALRLALDPRADGVRDAALLPPRRVADNEVELPQLVALYQGGTVFKKVVTVDRVAAKPGEAHVRPI